MTQPRKADEPITKADRVTTGVVDYFPNALAAIGRWSTYNNTKYPPAVPSPDGSPRWSFDTSPQHADAIGSHLAQRGTVDAETGFSHSVPLAWRALALLESELVAAGAKPGLGVLRAAPAASAKRYGVFYVDGDASPGPSHTYACEGDCDLDTAQRLADTGNKNTVVGLKYFVKELDQ